MQSAGGIIQVEGLVSTERDAVLRSAGLVVHGDEVGVAHIETRCNFECIHNTSGSRVEVRWY